jgi:hypothetical protein
MKRTLRLGCLAVALALAYPAFGESPAGNIVSGQAAASKLELRGLEVGSDGSITGTVVNSSGIRIKDVVLLVTHAWSWSDERHPGEDNPGRASYVRVPGEIAANRSLPFSYTPDPPLMNRKEGRFVTTAAVHSFSEVGD